MIHHNIRQHISVSIIILTFFIACDKTEPISGKTINGLIEHGGLEREYFLYTPISYTGNEPVPLVLNFHGFTQYADDYIRFADFRSIADTAGFIVVYPQGTLYSGLTHWNVGGVWTVGSRVDDVGFTEALIDYVALEYNIDISRVYATGLSNGGYMSFHLACQLSHKIAAIASVAGSMTSITFNNCDPEHSMPILQVHGTKDPLVPYEGNLFSKSIDDVLRYWVNYNNCDTSQIIIDIPHNINTTNNSSASHYSYNNGDNGSIVKHYKITGGGHDWPGISGNMDFNTCDEIWKFFSMYDIYGKIG